MDNNKKKYYGDYSDAYLLSLLLNNNNGACSEILKRLREPLMDALSDQLTTKIYSEQPLSDYVDFLLYAEIFAGKITRQTFTLLWENRSQIKAVTLFQAVLEMLKIALITVDVQTKMPYGQTIENQVLCQFVLQYKNLKRNPTHWKYVLDWISCVQGVNHKLFILRYFEGKKIIPIREELNLSALEVERQLEIIRVKFEDHLQNNSHNLS